MGSDGAGRFFPKETRGGTRGEGSSGRGKRVAGGAVGRMRATKSVIFGVRGSV